jgi:predicted nucleotidyltransferase
VINVLDASAVIAIREAAARHGADRVRVFGSFARGEARANSDLDLVVSFESGRTLLDLVALEREIQELVGRHVDIATEGSLPPLIRDRVLEEAVTL